ncbi:pulmonary surfactant-associated protein D-like [Aquarana catesbeiana]|uniref:pulmonary surfactant-associated protein D-like n=1 Tax=Aquarana catesbeiana TaxID=8400 RepID=UPI003CCA2943
MKALRVFGVLLLHVALVMSSTQICQDVEKSGCSIITCGAPGKDGEKGEKGERGIIGLPGFPGHPGPPGDCKDSVCEDLQSKLKALEGQLKAQQTESFFFKGRARSSDKIFLSDGDQGNFNEAKARCTNAGGQMASPRNSDENKAILSINKQYGFVSYLGINELETPGIYRDPSNEVISYTNWKENEPNNYQGIQENCVELQNTGKWNDIVCEAKRLIICEFFISRG